MKTKLYVMLYGVIYIFAIGFVAALLLNKGDAAGGCLIGLIIWCFLLINLE